MELPERIRNMNTYTRSYYGYGNGAYTSYLSDRTFFPYFLVLFLISPLLGLISAMANFRKRGAKSIILLFMGAYGYTFILNPGNDAYKISMVFVEYYQFLSPAEFANNIWAMLTLNTTDSMHSEPYLAIVSYLIAQFTSDTNIFMMFVSLIFGIAYIKGIHLVYQEREDSWNFVSLTLFVLFITWIAIVGVNHPRNYTGGCVFFVGAYLYIKNQDYKYLFIVLLAPLVHFMYLAVTIPFFVYVLFKDQKYVYISVLVISFVASAGLDFFEPILTSTSLGEQKVGQYTGSARWDPDAAPSSFEKDLSFHAEYYRFAGRWAVNIMFFFSIVVAGYFSGKHHDRLQTGLGSVAILTMALSNFTTAIPALSGRTFTYFGLFAIAYLLRLFSKKDEKLKAYHWVVYLCFPAILLYVFTMYSRAGDFMDFKVLVSPLLYPFLSDDPVSIKEFLRIILDL